jgi:hypothetical protein
MVLGLVAEDWLTHCRLVCTYNLKPSTQIFYTHVIPRSKRQHLDVRDRSWQTSSTGGPHLTSVHDWQIEKEENIDHRCLETSIILIIIIQFSSLLFVCWVNSYKANYRQDTTTTIIIIVVVIVIITLWPWSVSELYRSSDCRLSAKLVPTFADVSRGHRNGSLRMYSLFSRYWTHYFYLRLAPNLYS